jgi:hypothetical protein
MLNGIEEGPYVNIELVDPADETVFIMHMAETFVFEH